ncbi:hypothetical protein EHI8A_183890 [Entamoeba histolytica HM-1:IMSS-B]|uniref:Uncharacterized protein n=6 Tax=Entamoeba histolytica TaxID=5759 RepID=C4M9I3_ENTH1|nr:hypothetical protein EHI_187780 [Entamoeba histolytica HM-1:IMSS]EMD43733.1 Hypothetical protein EHI5A_193940 [Entamoeba histolytica KU27]EMH74547.1 hypothetical protein EHI8A_183890 [Entamoeba histolytica HM-1:IMSS-B]EMS12149.1 hypothetical protein KM1_300450 [Entamoeba histolytica HM-3:IMSS]ENY62015.1 hypothetical protein EHI7A_162680 [Entamoeba histolytica HM-1:IMSS-A]GAT98329.1 hypothetical protein CL6EHI_187780 [Entamoeba histolytica]|eukprot:XP_648242.1 hypothetical protein EHI_187780 [Entamoeba histolytica HM-1:IMSS]
MERLWRFKYPLLSGISGSIGGLFSKGITSSYIPFAQSQISIVIRCLCVVLMFGCNGVGGFFFAKALSELPSLTATITSTITGFIMSGIIGGLIGEYIPIQWYLGMIILIAGVILLIVDNSEKEQHQNGVKEE